MKNLFEAGKLLLLDMASTFFFLVLLSVDAQHYLLSVALGMALWHWPDRLAVRAQTAHRHHAVDEPLSVLGAGAATLITDDPRFVMMKPTVIYTIVGIVMLKPGWMNRYLPPVAIEIVPDIAFIFIFVWRD